MRYQLTNEWIIIQKIIQDMFQNINKNGIGPNSKIIILYQTSHYSLPNSTAR